MNLYEAIFSRKSVRKFRMEPVDAEFLAKLRKFLDNISPLDNQSRVEFEIIQPVKGPNCYFRFLEEKGEGLHHVKVPIEKEEVGEMVRYFEAGGNPILQTGWVDGDFHAYPDTQDDLAMMIELGVPGPIDVPYELYPPEAVSKEV